MYEILETRAIINRLFHADKEENVFSSAVHYDVINVNFHAPEACLGGDEGLEIKKKQETNVISR